MLSATLARRLNKLPDALAFIQTAAALLPSDPAVALEAGNIAIAAGDDNTARKHVEDERLRLAQTLRVKNTELEAASRLKSEFLANMSHELRTPLNAIIGFAELLHDGQVDPASPTHKEFLGDILSSGRHLLQLINDVLDLSRLDAGHADLHEEEFDPAELISESLRMLMNQAGKAQIGLSTHIEPGLPWLKADKRRIKQILINLISNARKYCDSDPGVLRIVVRQKGGVSNPVSQGEVKRKSHPVGATHKTMAIAMAACGVASNSGRRLSQRPVCPRMKAERSR